MTSNINGTSASQNRKVLTLVLLRENGNVLLGLKKRGFGEGKWNGFGGKIEPGETIQEAAVREVQEECGLVVKVENLLEVGNIDFEFVGDPVILEVHIFTAYKFEGIVQETEEMRPKWFRETEVPFESMWADDRLWFPLLLSGKKFKGHFLFEGHSKIVSHTLNELN